MNHIRLETTEQQKEISKRLTQNAVQFKKERIYKKVQFILTTANDTSAPNKY